jgi:cell volume regulation protein A
MGAAIARGEARPLDTLAAVNLGVLLIGLLIVVGIASSLIAARVGAPLLLIFLLIGMLAGEDGPGGVLFSDYRAAYYVGSFALAIILFDGGLRMKVARFRGAFAPALVLSTLGVVLTAAIAGLAAMLVLKLSLAEGMLVGAIIGSTDAAAVLFLLGAGGLQLRRRIGATLEIESGTNDPAALLLTILLVEVVLAADGSTAREIVELIAAQVLIGGLVGSIGGLAIVVALNRLALPPGLPPLFVVAAAVSLYGMAAVAGGSGFLAVYLAGLVVGNRPIRTHAAVLRFHDAVTWLAQIVMFIVLGLLVTPTRLVGNLAAALAVSAALMLIARPTAVWLSVAPFGFSVREKTFLSWVGLRGAVSIFLAAIPMLAGLPNAAMYFDVAFVVVLVSLTLQGWTVAPAARWMGVARGDAAPSVNRVEIDLPDRLDLEMVGYPVQADSYVVARGRLPRWLRPLLVLRQGQVLPAADAGLLEPGDFAYFLAPRNRLQFLDRIFAAVDLIDHGRGEGLFSFRGEASLGGVAKLYGASLPTDLADRTISEAFALRWDGAAEVGDRIELGSAALIASAVSGESVTMAALDLEPNDGAGPGNFASAATRQLAVAGRRLWRRTMRGIRGLRAKPAAAQGALAAPGAAPDASPPTTATAQPAPPDTM